MSQAPAPGWQKDGTYVPCQECKWDPPTERLYPPGKALHFPGTTHEGDCPTIPRLSREAERKLQADLDEIARCQRRAWASARNYVIG